MNEVTKKKLLSFCTQAELARRLGKRPQTVCLWFKKNVASVEVINVCRVLKWKITPHEIRPDLYPNPADALPDQVCSKLNKR